MRVCNASGTQPQMAEGLHPVNLRRRPLGSRHASDGAMHYARPWRQRHVAQQLTSAMYEAQPLLCCKLPLTAHLHGKFQAFDAIMPFCAQRFA